MANPDVVGRPAREHAEQGARERLAATARWLSLRGWAPATSGNFSARLGRERVLISPSGIDKQGLASEQLVEIDLEARPLRVGQPGASAEALLHTAIYRRFRMVGAVLHVHTVGSTVLSRRVGAGRQVRLSGYELLKALSGTRTHEAEVRVPVFANDQDLARLARQVCAWWGTAGASNAVPGLLLEGHGLYAWGATIEDARRHLEALEFIFNCEILSAAHAARTGAPMAEPGAPAETWRS